MKKNIFLLLLFVSFFTFLSGKDAMINSSYVFVSKDNNNDKEYCEFLKINDSISGFYYGVYNFFEDTIYYKAKIVNLKYSINNKDFINFSNCNISFKLDKPILSSKPITPISQTIKLVTQKEHVDFESYFSQLEFVGIYYSNILILNKNNIYGDNSFIKIEFESFK